MFITFFLSVVWDVEIGIIVSLIISLLLVIRRSSKTRMTILVCPLNDSVSTPFPNSGFVFLHRVAFLVRISGGQ